jgi:hypothetical protein
VTHVFYIRTYASVKAEADKKAKEKAEKSETETPADIDSVPHDELMENSEEVEDALTAAEQKNGD